MTCLTIQILRLEKNNMQFFKFILVGGGATAVHLGVANLLFFFFKEDVSIYAINSFAFLNAFLFSYIGHRYITFSCQGSMIKFFLVAFAGFLLNNSILTFGLFLNFEKITALVVATILVPIFTYFLSLMWVFKFPHSKQSKNI